ncbi:MAG: hypothetical protein NTW22_07305, partial [Proteobacteria bacterium]|nr:hypothetical protein [Pseudomonadota bacterium]
MGIFYSKKFNIIENKVFANLTDEEGQGGKTLYGENHPCHSFKERVSEYWSVENREKQSLKMKINNPSRREDVKEKLKILATGRKFSDEVNKKKGRSGNQNVSKRDDVRMKISQNLTGRKLSQETKEKI